MSFAGGDIGGVTTFENTDYIEAEQAATEALPEATTIGGDEGTFDSGDIIVGGGDTVGEVSTSTPVDITPAAPVEQVAPVATPAPVTTPTKSVSTSESQSEKSDSSSSFLSGLGLGDGKFYLGLAVSDMAVRADDDANLFSEEKYQDRQTGITIVAGYDFMKYLGAELRAALAVDGENENQDKLKEFGIYLKPKYVVPALDNKLTLYALLGYSSINMSDPVEGELHHGTPDSPFDGTNSGFSYGYGLDYSVTPNISVFTDIVNYLRNFGGSNSTWGANVGVRYNF